MVSMRMFLVLLAASLLIGCVNPDDSGSGTTAGAGKGKANGTITVCGENFSLGDILEHPMFRQAFKQFITLQQLYAEASKAGITITDEELTKEVDKQKEQITSSGQDWNEFLKMQGMSEEEVRQMIKTQKLFEKLVDNKLDLTEETMRKYFEEHKDEILNAHIQSNFLPEAERANLKYEDCIDSIKEAIRARDGYKFQQELMDDLTLNATLDLSKALPAEEAKKIEAQILGDEQQKVKDRQAGAAAAEKPADATGAMGETPTPPAGEGAPAGQTETKPAAGDEAGKGAAGGAGEKPAEPAPAPTETK